MAERATKLDLAASLRAAEQLTGDLGWSKLALLAFKDEELVSAEGKAITPELILLSLAIRARERGLKAIVVLNARKEHALNLMGQEGLSALSEIASKLGLDLLYFGPSSEGPLASLRRIKLDMDWLALNAAAFARLAEAASPVDRKAGEVDVSSISAISRFLINMLGPPSLKEDMITRIKGADKYQVAADAISTAAAIISPTALIGTGLKYAAKFFNLVRQRRREEYRAYLETWRKNVEAAFAEEVLANLLGEDGLGPLKERLGERGLAIVVQDVIGTPHELFLPLLISSLAEELEGEGALLALDGVSHLARLELPVKMLSSLPGEREGLRLACFMPTGGFPRYERLPDLVRSLAGERVAIFDLDPAFVDVVCEGKSAAFRAALLRCLELAARERLEGHLAYVFYDAARASMPELVVFRPGLWARLKARLSRLRRWGT